MVKGTMLIINIFLLISFVSIDARYDFARLQRIKPFDIEIVNNGYNILLGISDEIPESQGREMMSKLRTIINAFSRELHDITG